MPALGHQGDESGTSFGQRRGQFDATRVGLDLDLTSTRVDRRGAAGRGSYPSPPMSGSPPLPPKTSHEVAGRGHGAYHVPPPQDVYAGTPTTRSEERTHAGAPDAARPHPFLADAPERALYAYSRPEELPARSLLHPQQLGQALPQPAAYLSALGTGQASNLPGPLPVPPTYSAPSHHTIPEALHNSASKPQRKTKGHVASACVPCKKAHLRFVTPTHHSPSRKPLTADRCDAQRPCSRCISTNKEAACVDVQHKKRGRPRLRDDGQAKYEGVRPGVPADTLRRPLPSAYGSGPALGMLYDDPLRRTQSYRVIKSQPAESAVPRFLERGLASDANIYPAPLSISTARLPEEPVAYLTLGLEFSKTSASFLGAIGRATVVGLKLAAVLAADERPKAARLQQQAQEEQTRKEPAYLPPIFGDRSDSVMQTLGFTPEEVSRYPLQWLDTFTFQGDDGHERSIPLRAGVATRNSIYFVVLLLNRMPPSSYPTPSPSLRDMVGTYEPGLQTYSQPTPLSATFDLRQARLSDPGYDFRQAKLSDPGYDSRHPGPHGAPPQLQMMAAPNPGLSTSAYGASPSRPDYPITPRAYQASPRGDVHQPPGRRPSQPAEYHQLLPLPRIRSPPAAGGNTQPLQPSAPQLPQQQQAPRPPAPPMYETREERSRMGIGGLLEHPEPTTKPP